MSTNVAVQAIINRGQTILAVDDTRPAGHPFRLPDDLRALVSTRLAEAIATSTATPGARAQQRLASGTKRAAFRNLDLGLRLLHAHVAALLPAEVPVPPGGAPHVTKAERLGLFTRFGFPQGELGFFTDARRETLARDLPQALAVPVANPAWLPPAALVTFLTQNHDALQLQQPGALTGARQIALAERAAAARRLDQANRRVRGFYMSASDAGDTAAELARILYQPRRPRRPRKAAAVAVAVGPQ